MAQVSFRCSSSGQVLLNVCDVEVDDVADAREQAAMVVRSLVAIPGPEDWRAWVLHVNDDLGDEIFALPFSSVMTLH